MKVRLFQNIFPLVNFFLVKQFFRIFLILGAVKNFEAKINNFVQNFYRQFSFEQNKPHPDIWKTVGGDRFFVKRELQKTETKITPVEIF